MSQSCATLEILSNWAPSYPLKVESCAWKWGSCHPSVRSIKQGSADRHLRKWGSADWPLLKLGFFFVCLCLEPSHAFVTYSWIGWNIFLTIIMQVMICMDLVFSSTINCYIAFAFIYVCLHPFMSLILKAPMQLKAWFFFL